MKNATHVVRALLCVFVLLRQANRGRNRPPHPSLIRVSLPRPEIFSDNKGAVSTDDMQITVKKNYADMVAASSIISSDAMIEEPVEATVKEGSIGISPNPATSSVQLHFSSSVMGETNIIVYDLNGRTVKQIVASKTQTMITQNVDVHDLAKGIYYAVAKTGNKSYAPLKFVKQ